MMGYIKKILWLFFLPLLLGATELLNFDIPFKPDLYLKKQGFSLGYSYTHRQAIWVAYTLTADNLRTKQVRRKNKFRADPEVKFHPVKPRDYAKTGYDKGHLAPAADMTYSIPSMENSFFMTNISPQIPGCNRGIWRRVENQTRKWAMKEESIYVITGPIFSKNPELIGKSALPIPIAFYKVLFDLTPPHKMIAFVVPNQTSRRRVASFAVTVDEVERITGYDFFSELDDALEDKLEKDCDFRAWEQPR